MRKRVTHVSGTSVTLDSGLNTYKGGELKETAVLWVFGFSEKIRESG